MRNLIIFDFDGVIADSEVITNQSLAEGLSAIGMPTSLDDSLKLYMGKRWRDCQREIEARHGMALPAGFIEQQRDAAAARVAREVRAVVGVEAFIEQFAITGRCIASSSTVPFIAAGLQRLGLADRFAPEHVFSGQDIERGKPHPDIYWIAAAAMGRQVADCIVIEDSPTGVQAGVAAGMLTIGLCAGGHVRDGHAESLKCAGAHHVVASYEGGRVDRGAPVGDPMIPDPLDAVIFDMDGLLLDTEVLWRDTLFAVGDQMGRPVTHAMFAGMVGHPREVNDAVLQAHFGDSFDPQDFHTRCAAHWNALSAGVMPLRPGAREMLEYLAAAGVPRAVATSTARPAAEDCLRRAGLLDLLDVLVTRSDVERGKPDPESFLTAARLLGARPAQCLALEDSHNGVRAAAAAGMSTVMVPDMLPATAEMRGLCAAVADSLDEVRLALIARG